MKKDKFSGFIIKKIDNTVKFKNDEFNLVIYMINFFSFFLILMSIFSMIIIQCMNKRIKVIENNNIIENLIKYKLSIKKSKTTDFEIKEFKSLMESLKLDIVNNNIYKTFYLIKNKIFIKRIYFKNLIQELENIEQNLENYNKHIQNINKYNKHFKLVNSLLNIYMNKISSKIKNINSSLITNKDNFNNYLLKLIKDKSSFDLASYYNKVMNNGFSDFIKFKFYNSYKNIIIFNKVDNYYSKNIIKNKKYTNKYYNTNKLFVCSINLLIFSNLNNRFKLLFVNKKSYNINKNNYWWLKNKYIRDEENKIIINETFFFEINKINKDLEFNLLIIKYSNNGNIHLLKEKLECIIYNNFK